MPPDVDGNHERLGTLATTLTGERLRYKVLKGGLASNGRRAIPLGNVQQESTGIDEDISGDLPIGAVADDCATLDLGDVYDDHRPYLDSVLDVHAIVNVLTRVQRAQTNKSPGRESVPEAYAKEPAPLNT